MPIEYLEDIAHPAIRRVNGNQPDDALEHRGTYGSVLRSAIG